MEAFCLQEFLISAQDTLTLVSENPYTAKHFKTSFDLPILAPISFASREDSKLLALFLLRCIEILQRVTIKNTCPVEGDGVIMKISGKRVSSALVILFLSAGLCHAQKVVNECTIKGVDYASQGKFTEAKSEFEKALKVAPSFGPAQRALSIIEDVTDQKIASQSAVNYFKGIAHAIKGQHDQAIPYYNKAIKINPRFANAYFSRGVAYAQGKGQYDEAISDYSKAIEINPDFAKAIALRGYAYYSKGEYDKAWVDVHKVQSLGYPLPPGFLRALSEVSGRRE